MKDLLLHKHQASSHHHDSKQNQLHHQNIRHRPHDKNSQSNYDPPWDDAQQKPMEIGENEKIIVYYLNRIELKYDKL